MTPVPDIAAVAGKLTKCDAAVLLRLADNWQAAFMLSPDNAGWQVVPALMRLRKAGLAQSRMGGAQCLNWAITERGKQALHLLENGGG